MAAANVHDHFTLFLDSLTNILLDDTLSIGSTRHRKVLEGGHLLREKLLSDADSLRKPVEAIVSAVEKISTNTLDKSVSAIRWKKILQNFHLFREELLLELWEKLGDSLGLLFNPILLQATTEKIFPSLLKKYCASTAPVQPSSMPGRQLTPSEECAVMYCGGYVVRSWRNASLLFVQKVQQGF